MFDQRSCNRARRAINCLPFSDALYQDLRHQGLDAGHFFCNRRTYQRNGRWYRHSDALEKDLLWLISVGVLRREVDGQGLTNRFRLTPLGRQILDNTPDLFIQSISWIERLRNGVRRLLS
ncbi:Npun_F0494 family protein [Synechococcus sp. M16CYN]|uniref:Npun_F0494 family protein n=1 Tax=Synechococcus sp. M16CYN TaxID=3103139 RepID=UPI00324380FB